MKLLAAILAALTLASCAAHNSAYELALRELKPITNEGFRSTRQSLLHSLESANHLDEIFFTEKDRKALEKVEFIK